MQCTVCLRLLAFWLESSMQYWHFNLNTLITSKICNLHPETKWWASRKFPSTPPPPHPLTSCSSTVWQYIHVTSHSFLREMLHLIQCFAGTIFLYQVSLLSQCRVCCFFTFVSVNVLQLYYKAFFLILLEWSEWLQMSHHVWVTPASAAVVSWRCW